MRDFDRMRRLDSPSTPKRPSLAVLAVLLLAPLLPAQSALAASSESIQKEMDAVAAQYGRLETRLAQTEAKQAALTKQQQEAQATIAAKSAALKARAGYMYRNGGATQMLSQLLTAPTFGEFVRRVHFMGVLGSNDTQLMEELSIAQARSDEAAAKLSAEEARQSRLIKDLSNERKRLESRFAEARQAEDAKRRAAAAALKEAEARKQRLSAERKAQLEATAKGAPKVSSVALPQRAGNVSSAGRFARFTLPVTPAGFADTWGAARSGGRRHQGTDVMSPCGAPVVAVTDGSIQRLASSGAGGTSLYLRASNGDVFFYAHLRGYAGGVSAGKSVTAGQVIASNGNSGNARGGPCHVHFEWHPSGGRPVNPYPLLASAR